MSDIQLMIPIVWAMPNKYTFQIKPVFELIMKYYDSEKIWVDPFAGQNHLGALRNDLNPDSPCQYHLDAVEFVKMDFIINELFDGWFFDPPYSLTQVGRSYQDFGIEGWNKDNPTGSYPMIKDVISKTTKRGGYVISCGWNTCGMGKKRGFEKVDGLCCEHGSGHNNTLVIVERKL